MPEPVLQVQGVSKSFAGNEVLDAVSFAARAGEAHALVGENGAGKSTLMNVIGGIHQADDGEVRLQGRHVRFADPLQAIRAGISIVHQELSLAPNLTVAQNVFSHREDTGRLGFIRWRAMFDKTRALFERMGLDIAPTTLAGELSVGAQQIVEIAKALSLDARVIIMDEPTSALSDREVTRLFSIVGDLKRRGVAVVFISHKLDEVFEIADRISVLRDGRMVGTVETAETSPRDVIRMMVGRHIDDLYPRKSSGTEGEIFAVRGLSGRGFRDVSFSLRRGEILGLAGLVGSGRTEVARAIFGCDDAEAGEVFLEGERLDIGSPRDAIERGVCYLTEDRRTLGLFLTMPLRKNIVSAALGAFVDRLLFLKRRAIRRASLDYIDSMQIQAFSDELPVISLSGGNQQKTLLAKWLCAGPKVLIADEPTRGVDVGAKARIHRDLRRLAEQGVGVIVISSELPEVLGLSDRIAVFHEGTIAAVLDGDATQEQVMHHATAQETT